MKLRAGTRKHNIVRAFMDSPRHRLNTGQLAHPEVGGSRFGARIEELRHEHGIDILIIDEFKGGATYELRNVPRARLVLMGAGPDAASTSAPEGSVRSGGVSTGASTREPEPGPAGDPGEPARLFEFPSTRSAVTDSEAA